MKMNLIHDCIKLVFVIISLAFCKGALASSKILPIYVSSRGSDKNIGTQKLPMKSITAALKYKRPIKLKRGDVFYESIHDDGCDISAYGNGENPKVCGWKFVPANKGLWVEGKMINGNWIQTCGTHIWRIDLQTLLATGRISGNNLLNNIGLIINTTTKETIGHKCEYLYADDCIDSIRDAQTNTFVNDENDFWQCSKKDNVKFTSEDFQYLYIYCNKDPNQYAYAFSTYGNAITVSNAKVEGVDVEGFGCHGLSCGSNVKIFHCKINHIGGSQLLGYKSWVRYGNGVEFLGPKQNGEVAYNVISYTFDCGSTIQGNCGDSSYAKNIIFHDNLFHNCRQAFEIWWVKNSKTGFYHDVENCAFINNICKDNGHDNGFNSPEVHDTHILTYSIGAKTSLRIKGNKFYGGNGLLTSGYSKLLTFDNNTYYLDEGAILWTDYSGKYKIVYYKNNANAAVKAFEHKVGGSKLKFKLR
ncbi:MAG TPA: hypothetical protein DCS83_05235 [Prevotella sp.]|nr:hypothetical protein [uncultured Prevotella sp.]HAT61938.1 hypothetical protein [Prevotella sp.]